MKIIKQIILLSSILFMFTGCAHFVTNEQIASYSEAQSKLNEANSTIESLNEENMSMKSELGDLNDRLRIIDEEKNLYTSISEQGSFTVGGKVKNTNGKYNPKTAVDNSKGQTLHGDHMTVYYQLPVNKNDKKIIFIPDENYTKTSFMTTPDERSGWSNIFLKKGYGVYLTDLPRSGEASQTTKGVTINSETKDQSIYTKYRIGEWPDTYSNSQFPSDEKSLNQFFRMLVPNTGEKDLDLISEDVKELLNKTGKSIVLVHGKSIEGVYEASKDTENMLGIIAIEPESFVFPKSKKVENINTKYKNIVAKSVSDEEFNKIINRPIVLLFGDNIPKESSDTQILDYYYGIRKMADIFMQTVVESGGDCVIIDLPNEGIKGNSSVMFMEKNNEEVANQVMKWIDSTDFDTFELNKIEETESSSENNETVETKTVDETTKASESEIVTESETENSSSEEGDGEVASNSETTTNKIVNLIPKNERKTLVAYFTLTGTSEIKATYITGLTQADLYKIEPTTPYSKNYEECYPIALNEKETNARPSILNPIASVDEYTDIFICYPVWCDTAPMIIGTFLNGYDFTGKHIYPITQSTDMKEESLNNSISFITNEAKGAIVHNGIMSTGTDATAINNYLIEKGFIG